MMPRLHPRATDAAEALTGALGRPVCGQEELSQYTVVAYWPGLGLFASADEHKTWTSADWAQHLNDPTRQRPFAAGPQDDRRAIWHADMRLHPGDRALTGPEWSETAHRLARTAGIHIPGDEHGCRWIAVQAQPGRLDLIANLIRPDDAWQRPQSVALLTHECRRIEQDFGLIAPVTGTDPAPAAHSAAVHSRNSAASAEDAAQLSHLLRRLADEDTSQLASIRGLIEHAAHRLDDFPHTWSPETGHRLEWIARRLHGIQEDCRSIAHTLTSGPAATPRHATAPPPRVRPATSQAPLPSSRRTH
jgi:hypothetical protein